ncbi:HYR domain-containing protein [Leucobacter sp. HY1910]
MKLSWGKSRAVLLAGTAIMALLIVTFVAVPGARADSGSVSGTITAADPTYTHLNPVAGNPCAVGSIPTHYRVIAVKVGGLADTNLTIAVNPVGFAANISLYQGAFLPEGPHVNCWGSINGSGAGATVPMTTPINALPAPYTEQTFYLVVSGLGASDLGDFSVDVSSTITPIEVTLLPSAGPVIDTTPPVVTVPQSPVIAEAQGPAGASVSYSATATDDVDGALTPTCSPASGSRFPFGSTLVTCTATDAAGSVGTGSFTVDVIDTTGPRITTQGPVRAVAEDASGSIVTYWVTASDLVEGARPVSCSPASGSRFPLGSTPVTCTSSDSRNNSSTATFTVHVSDEEAPVVSVPAPISAEATGPGGAAVNFTAAANDAVDGVLTPSCNPASGSTFPLGVTTVTCDAIDTAGNTGSQSFTVTVQDSVAPTLLGIYGRTAEATGADGATVDFTVTAADLVDGALTATCTPASGSLFALGDTTVTCTATDSQQNTATGSFHIMVSDTTEPTVSTPAAVTTEAESAAGSVVTFTATASDTVDGSLPTSCTPASGELFPLGDTTVTCTAEDDAGNIGSASFVVSLVDTTAPMLAGLDSVTAEAEGPDGAEVSYTVTASDLVEGSVAASCTPASGTVFALGDTTVNCEATDAQGNSATGSFTVTIEDTTEPALTLPGALSIEAEGPGGATIDYTATAEDLVDGALVPACTPASGAELPLGTATITCEVSDAAGNIASGDFEVTVRDTTAPIITVPSDMRATASSPAGAVVTYVASANDLVDGAVAPSCAPMSGSTLMAGVTTVTCAAVDAAENTATADFAVTVEAYVPPKKPTPDHKKPTTATPLRQGPSLATTGGAETIAGGLTVSLLLAGATLLVAARRRQRGA